MLDPVLLFRTNQLLDIAAVFFGGAPSALVAEKLGVGLFLTGGLELGLWSAVFEVLWQSDRADSFLCQTDDMECLGDGFGPCDHSVAYVDFARWLGDDVIDAHSRTTASFSGISARLI